MPTFARFSNISYIETAERQGYGSRLLCLGVTRISEFLIENKRINSKCCISRTNSSGSAGMESIYPNFA